MSQIFVYLFVFFFINLFSVKKVIKKKRYKIRDIFFKQITLFNTRAYYSQFFKYNKHKIGGFSSDLLMEL